MPEFQFGNFFATELTVGITPGTTILQVPPSATLQLPLFDALDDKEARLTLWDGQLPPEIVGCTVNEQDGNLIVTRAKEGTTAQAWSAGTQVISTLTAEVINAALEAFFDFEDVLAASFLKLTGGVLTGPLILDANPVTALGAATKQYVDGVQGTGLPLSGGTMQGDINMNNNDIINLPTPTVNSNPATKQYVDNAVTSPTDILNDYEGSLVSGGTASAYTVTSNDTPGSYVNGTRLCIKFGATNNAAATLNMDSLGAKPLEILPGVAIPAGIIQAGVPTVVVFDSVEDAWLLETQAIRAAELRLTEGTGLGDPAADDVAVVNDTSLGGPRTTTLANLLKVINALSTEATLANDDKLVLYDTSAAEANGITITTLLAHVAAQRTLPTYQRLLTGTSATYNTPANVRRLRVKMVGGGGGGGDSSTPNGGNGGTTQFESWTAIGGTGGVANDNNGGSNGGSGGAAGTGTLIERITGQRGGNGTNTQNTIAGGDGGCSPHFSGGGRGSMGTTTASSGLTNTGGGGGGEGASTGSAGGGGGSGEFVEFYIDAPSSSYTYTVGAAGSAGGGGGAGGSGVIIVEEIY